VIPVDRAFAIVRSTPVSQTTIVLADDAAACDMAVAVSSKGNLWVLGLSILGEEPSAPGTYDLAPTPGEPRSFVVSAELTRADENCSNVPRGEAVRGEVTLASVGASRITGSYRLEFADEAGTLEGSFDAPVCPAPSEPSTVECNP
jgi:hypothetical protein